MSFLYRLYDESHNTNKSIQLRDNFNHPETLEEPEHFDSLVRGLATQMSQKSDLYYENDVSRVLCEDIVCFKIYKLKYFS
jgi:hypothetical protein